MRSTCLLLLGLMLLGPTATTAQTRPVPLIFDTDFGPDYDDVGAIALLHAFADSAQVEILATVASTNYPRVGQVIHAFNTYFGRPELPIGVPKGKAVSTRDSQGWSDLVLERYPHHAKPNDQLPDAVAVYRQQLARRADRSVTIVTVGFLTNLANLLDSKPDKYSRLSGRELVAQKVGRLVCMAGKFPQGREFNVHEDAPAAQKVFEQWPTEIVFSGFEIGQKIKTGLPLIQNAAIQSSPVQDVFALCIPKAKEDQAGRMSWDQTAVLVAALGAEPYYTLAPGRIVTKDDGSNTWDATKSGHFHLVEKMPVEQVTRRIDHWMQHPPRKKR
ncbi:nucleoside hydrolase [Rhabdobacter roseus]|uniref:Inosine-uridine nucleoside N-ribohydrolase n=1 Tax=Rhabdobacter roseus TaxID=1655419 RepID=A0A840TY00_9BACT|nr:nucleoside hydrolase [Rhabdobacter roseus]MBB5286447.1 inosine-uridine nucleoside N-ribohydrolase [Rhabdobacter roseus]